MWTIEKDGHLFYNLADFLAVYHINAGTLDYKIVKRLAFKNDQYQWIKYDHKLFINQALLDALKAIYDNLKDDSLYFYNHRWDTSQPWKIKRGRQFAREKCTIADPQTCVELWVAVVNKIMGDLKGKNQYYREVAAHYVLTSENDLNEVLILANLTGIKGNLQCLAREVISKK